jgi:tetratricopeptide (TPR) repeat protein
LLNDLQPYTTLLTAVVVVFALWLFKEEVRKLVAWIVSFKQVKRTADGGVSLLGAPDPDPQPSAAADESQRVKAIIDASADAVASAVVQADERKEEKKTGIEEFVGKRYEEAIRLFKEDLDHTTDVKKKFDLQGMIAWARFHLDTNAGSAEFEALIKAAPARSEAYSWYAFALRYRELYDKALTVIEQGIQATKGVDRAELFKEKAQLLLARGKFDDAIGAATAGIEADASFVENYLTIASIQTKAGSKDAARREYLRALNVSNANETVLAAYARFLSDEGNNAEAILRYRQLIGMNTANSENTEYLTLLGNCYLSAGLHNLALVTYLKANKFANEKEAWIVGNIGNLFNSVGLYDEAERHLTIATQLDPASQYAHERLAIVKKNQEEELERRQKMEDEASSTL